MATKKATRPKDATRARMTPAPARTLPKHALAIRERLERAVPNPACELRFRNAFELLIATILSAQSTDKTVNGVTPEVFRRWPDARALAGAAQDEVEDVVRRTGFYRNKAQAIRAAAEAIAREHAGKVPRTLEELVALKGVARKTANVVLGTAYGIASGFVVDTHVARVSQRLALTDHEEPTKIEADLCASFPQDAWVEMGHRLLLHGRYTCVAKAPMCADCPLNELCESRKEAPTGTWQSRAQAEAVRVAQGLDASFGKHA